MPKVRKALEPQQERSRESLRRLLKAVTEVLGQHGVEGTTIPRIAHHAGLGIIEDGALQPPVVQQKAAWLDQIDRHSEASREPQQGPGVLRNVGLEQGETQKRPPAAGTLGSLVVVCRDYTRFAADLCGSLSHSSLSSTV